MQEALLVVADDDGAVRVAQDDLCAHVYELIDEEESAFEHLLVDEHRAFGLCADHEQYAEQVGCESGPGCVADGHEGAVDEAFYFVVFLPGDDEVFSFRLDADAEAAEGGGDDAQVFRCDVSDAYAVAHHGSHADEGPHLDHVGQDGVFCAVEGCDALDGEQVRADAGDAGSHAAEHAAELLDVGFAGCVVDGCGAAGQHCCHDDVGRAGHGCFVQEHVGSPEPVGIYVVEVPVLVEGEVAAECLHSLEVGVEPAASYLVAARLCHDCLAAACQQGTEHHDAAAQLLAAADEVVAREVVVVEVLGAEAVVVGIVPCHLYAHVVQHLYLVVDIDDVGDVLDAHGFVGEQCGTEHLQGLVLCALRCDLAFQPVAAFDDE